MISVSFYRSSAFSLNFESDHFRYVKISLRSHFVSINFFKNRRFKDLSEVSLEHVAPDNVQSDNNCTGIFSCKNCQYFKVQSKMVPII